MPKGYVSRWKYRDKEKQPHVMDVWFASQPANAAIWDSETEAQNDCVIFNYWHIVIPVATGGTHVCKDFKVEKRAGGEFVVFCEGPFTIQPSAQVAGEGTKEGRV